MPRAAASPNFAGIAMLIVAVLVSYHAPTSELLAQPAVPSTDARRQEIPPVLESKGVFLPQSTEIPPAATAVERPDAKIVAAERVPLYGCAAVSCAIQGELPLGAPVATNGGSVKGFTPVATELGLGYVRDLYLKLDAGPVPFLSAGDPGCRRVALIFNIGIGEEPASGILDTLAAERVPATMFVMGWWVNKRPAILERLVRDGYLIGSHGDGLLELTSLTDDEVRQNVRQAAWAIEQATGSPPARFFTPYAAASDDRVRALVAAEGYLPVAWDVAAADYGPDATAEAVYERVMGTVYDGAIVELHLDGPASAESTGRALPRLIRDLRGQGYRFVTIPEMTAPCS